MATPSSESSHRKTRSLSGITAMLPGLYNVHTNEQLDSENRHFTMAETLIAALQEATQLTFMPDSSLGDPPTEATGSNAYLDHLIEILDPGSHPLPEMGFGETSNGDGVHQTGQHTFSPQQSLRYSTSPVATSSTTSSPQRTVSLDQGGTQRTLQVPAQRSLDLGAVSHRSVSPAARSLSPATGGQGHQRSISDVSRITLDSEPGLESSSCNTSVLSPPSQSPVSSLAPTEFGEEAYATGSPASVAFGFLRSFNDEGEDSRTNQLMAAMQLLVQPGQVPQDLLPSPVVTPGDIAAGRILQHQQSLRGNHDWAPPRNQIMFDIKRRVDPKPLAIKKQGYRCAGCGLRVEINYIKKFRFDEYLGKYFCTSCHHGDKRMVPARIIHRWDFSRYRVSVFSANLLDMIADEPAFDILTHNPKLVQSNSYLATAARLRLQLKCVAHYLRRCRSGVALMEQIDQAPHMAEDEAVYSINELVELRNGTLVRQLSQLVARGIDHVVACPLCTAKGYVCEICNNDADILFAFQLKLIARCEVCSNVYHRKCFQKAEACPRCRRREVFQRRQATMSTVDVEAVSETEETGDGAA
eukprot:m.82684 g.82684  ORF g.82684 m.82684 type:complete len:583 (-) comp14627_c0_seq1:112-1860(-)